MTIDCVKKLTFLSLMLASGGAVLAQTTTGGLTGKVADPKGAVIKGVKVRVKSDALTIPRETQTDDRGEWRLGMLPPGAYKITFHKEGYYGRTVDMYLGVSKTEALNLAMKAVEVASAVVEVVDATQMITAKTDVKTSTNFQGEQLLALPGRKDYTDLLRYAPGTDSIGRVRGADAKTGVRYSVDGVDTRDDLAAFNSQTSVSMVQPIYDSIQDIQVVQNSVNARSGRSLGSQYIMVTKRGGNEFAGTLRAYYGRDSWLSNSSNAQASASSKGDNLTTAQWSWTFSGPIIRDRLTFFLSGITSPVIRSSSSLLAWDTSNGSLDMLGPLHTGNAATDAALLAGPGNGYTHGVSSTSTPVANDSTDKQYDLRLTGALSADHSLDLKYSHRDRGYTNVANAAGYAALMEDARLLGTYRQKNDSYSLNYTGTLTNSTMLEVTVSRAYYKVGTDSNSINGAQIPVLAALESSDPLAIAAGQTNFPTYTSWYTDGLSTGQPLEYAFASFLNLMSSVVSPVNEKHQTDTIEANLKTYFEFHGQHELDAGVESYTMTFNPGTKFGQLNKVAYAGGWFKKGSDWMFPTVVWEGSDVNGQIYGALGPAPVLLEAWTNSADQENKTLGLWLNDQWIVNEHLNVNLGLRWNRYHMTNGDGRTLGKAIGMEPRFLVRWDPKGNSEHLFTLSFTRNNQGFSGVVASALATNPQNCYTLRGWKGNGSQPALSSLGDGTDGGRHGVRYVDYAGLTDSSNYADVPYTFVNSSVTTRLKDLRSPYADQWELTYTHNLSDASSVRIALVDKRFYRELMSWTDYTWDNLALSTDPSGRNGGTPQWLQVTNYGSTHRPRIYRSAEIALDQKLTSRLSWNLAWSYFYEYNFDEQGRLDYAAVKASTYDKLSPDIFNTDGVTRRNHRISSILGYTQPLGKGGIVYTLTGIYEPVNPSNLRTYYKVNGATAGAMLADGNTPANNPGGYAIPGSAAPMMYAYYGKPGDWKTGKDTFMISVSVSWNIPLGFRKLEFIGSASVSDLLHHVDHGAGYGSNAPIAASTSTSVPNGRVLGNFTGAGISSGLGWGNPAPYPFYQGMTSSTRTVTNVSAGIRF